MYEPLVRTSCTNLYQSDPQALISWEYGWNEVMPSAEPLPYDLLGGDAVLEPLLRDFYFNRLSMSSIAHLFPPDREETFLKQLAFQRMYWGGPDTYTPWRGHPRMRARHLPFPIGQAEADTWMSLMGEAVAASTMPVAVQSNFLARLRQIAQAMINQPTVIG